MADSSNPYAVSFGSWGDTAKMAIDAAKETGQQAFRGVQMEHMKEQTGVLKQQSELNEVAIQKAKYEQQQAVEQQKRGEIVLPLDQLFKQHGIVSPDVQKYATDKIMKEGYGVKQPDGTIGIRTKHQPEMWDKFQKDLVTQKTVGQMTLSHINQSIQAKEQEMQELGEKTETPKTKEQKDALQKEITGLQAERVKWNNAVLRTDEKYNATVSGIDAAMKEYGANAPPELKAAAAYGKETGDGSKFYTTLEKIAEAKAKPDKTPTSIDLARLDARKDALKKQYPNKSDKEIEGMAAEAIHKENVKELDDRAVKGRAVFGTVPLPGVPGVVIDRSGKTPKVRDATTGKELSREEVNSIASDIKESQATGTQRGGAMAAQLDRVSKLYNENMPELIRLRNKVAKKGLLPDTKFTDINAVNQWLMMKSSDPDMVELQGKLKLQADTLQKTLGGAQGGEWAFKVADTLLNPSFQGAAFARRMQSHGRDLTKLAKYQRTFGKSSVDEGGQPQAPKVGEVRDGYKFIGGNPANEASWKKVEGE